MSTKAYPPGVLDATPARRPSFPSLAQMFLAAYPDPEETVSLEQWRRSCHADLVDMSADQIDIERLKATMRLAYAPDSITPWLHERKLKLDGYAARLRR
jgi:hypothetical protein